MDLGDRLHHNLKILKHLNEFPLSLGSVGLDCLKHLNRGGGLVSRARKLHRAQLPVLKQTARALNLLNLNQHRTEALSGGWHIGQGGFEHLHMGVS